MAPCYCSVPGCSNNKKKMPYLHFHDFPTDVELRTCWVRAIRRDEGPHFKILRGSTYVCSVHFTAEDKYITTSGRTKLKKGAVPSRFMWNCKGTGVQAQWGRKRLADVTATPDPGSSTEDKPTEDNPYPTLFLGSVEPTPEKRPRLGRFGPRRSKTAKPAVEVSQEGSAISKTPQKPKTKRSNTGVEDHACFRGPSVSCGMTTALSPGKSQCIAEGQLKDDAACLLHTGIPLQEFHHLVSCLCSFATTSSSMPVEDQILLTLMKLRHNLDTADLAVHFKISDDHVSKTLTHWIDVTDSLVGPKNASR